MNKYYSTNPTFYVGIDCIIFGFSEGENQPAPVEEKL